MKTTKSILVVLFMVFIWYSSHSQEKYAVLITGDYAAHGVPEEHKFLSDAQQDNPMECFWFDTYLMWEMLVYEKGYTNDNIYILFADGEDYYFEEMWIRYDADVYHPEIIPPDGQITDYAATVDNVVLVLEGLLTGEDDFPQVKEDDFLFVWTFDHGGYDPSNPLDAYIYLLDGIMSDDYFALKVNPIQAHKKVFWMQQCYGGGFYDELEANNAVFHSAGQPHEQTRPCDNRNKYNVQVEESEIVNDHQYEHGEYNFHNYCAVVGETPNYINNYLGEPFTDADENSDNYISILECYNWEDSHESWNTPWWGTEDPLYSDIGNIGANTSLEYPTLLFDDIGGEGMTVSYRGLIGISKDIHVTSGNQLQFLANADVYLLNESKLIVDAGASLILEDNVNLVGKNSDNQLIIDGNIQIGSNVSFIAEEGATLQIEINNPELIVNFTNSTFTNAELLLYNDQTTITNSTFDNSLISVYDGSIFIDETDFLSSSIFAQKISESNITIEISDCNFTGTPLLQAISVENYPNFFVQNSSIANYRDAVSLYNCGYGESNQYIKNNLITENTGAGITMYRSYVDILHNTIEYNNIGIRCFDRSNIHIEGEDYTTTQKIRDNDSYEILASRGSFPYYLHWNLIEDDDNYPGDPIVKYTGQEEGLDVIYNCWGDNFNPDDDLDPEGAYIWEPVWDCNTGWGSGDGSEAEGMYLAARDKVGAEDYAGAQADFQQLVIQYPATKYAQAAVKEIYTLEVIVNNDYSTLKTYYNTEPNITNDPELSKLAGFLVNFCEIKLENWPTAIAWFEDVIQNPESIEDSIFAIIDLGYTYFLMENGGLKAAFKGSMTEHIPQSVEQFEEKRDYLLSLLPGDQLSETMKENINRLKTGELLQNVPNPFNGTTQIWYKLEEESVVELHVYDYTGKQINSFKEGSTEKGSHFIEFKADGLPAGIYFYSIEVNGVITDSKKMTVLK